VGVLLEIYESSLGAVMEKVAVSVPTLMLRWGR